MNHLTKDKEDTFKPGWDEYMPQGQLLTNSLVAFSILSESHLYCTHNRSRTRRWKA